MKPRRVSRLRGILAVLRYAVQGPRLFTGLAVLDEQTIHQCSIAFHWGARIPGYRYES